MEKTKRVIISIEPEVYEKAKAAAAREGISFAALVRRLLKRLKNNFAHPLDK